MDQIVGLRPGSNDPLAETRGVLGA